MKNLMQAALVGVAAWLLWKFIGSSSAGSFFGPGNQQLQDTWNNITGGTGSAWNDFWGLHPEFQRNNPATGNPIPDATIYPGDPGGWYNA